MTTPAPRRGRPPASTREALEEVAFDLLLRDGYEATTVQAIMEAGNVGRTTFFRYFGSKGGIVWGEFDRAVDRLRDALAAADDAPVLTAIRNAVVESTRLSKAASPDAWLDRFRVMDRDPALAAETAHHWSDWANVISAYVEDRTGIPATGPRAAAIGGAVQAAYVAVLRSWSSAAESVDVDVNELDRHLSPLCAALQVTVDLAE
ncbi:MAG: transcriptional regulator [Glaciihabitans sp.]|nr:transcriptional regulator [Glaciihabitans sp.]